ncbi:MAG: CarD family transcriptional regulator [Clostridiales bacterium]|nr:CarD family transcriptional regulator [Clostridiales bacterium]
MFDTNQIVLYGSNGVCKIIEITTKKVGGNSIEYYVLKPVYSDTSTLFVPTQNEQLVGKMRNIMSADEIYEILKNMPEDDNEWIDNKNDRFTACKDVISSGDCKRLVKLIRTLKTHETAQNKKGKKLHIADERFLKEAEKTVCDEFSLVLNIDHAKAMSLILDRKAQ